MYEMSVISLYFAGSKGFGRPGFGEGGGRGWNTGENKELGISYSSNSFKVLSWYSVSFYTVTSVRSPIIRNHSMGKLIPLRFVDSFRW